MLDTFKVDGQVWAIGRQYNPGDLVYFDLPGLMRGEEYICRQPPFGDFCSKYDPLYQMKVNAWELSGAPLPLPEPSQKRVECMTEEEV